MEFHVALDGMQPDAARLEAALLEQDPAAVLDLLPGTTLLRVSTWLPAEDLRGVLAAAGYPVPPDRMQQLPSVCCGGCSG